VKASLPSVFRLSETHARAPAQPNMMAAVVVRRLAALSGASAVAAGAYGAHGRKTHTHTHIRLRSLLVHESDVMLSGPGEDCRVNASHSSLRPEKLPIQGLRLCGRGCSLTRSSHTAHCGVFRADYLFRI